MWMTPSTRHSPIGWCRAEGAEAEGNFVRDGLMRGRSDFFIV